MNLATITIESALLRRRFSPGDQQELQRMLGELKQFSEWLSQREAETR